MVTVSFVAYEIRLQFFESTVFWDVAPCSLWERFSKTSRKEMRNSSIMFSAFTKSCEDDKETVIYCFSGFYMST
jgi:hypothetical protein